MERPYICSAPGRPRNTAGRGIPSASRNRPLPPSLRERGDDARKTIPSRTFARRAGPLKLELEIRLAGADGGRPLAVAEGPVPALLHVGDPALVGLPLDEDAGEPVEGDLE